MNNDFTPKKPNETVHTPPGNLTPLTPLTEQQQPTQPVVTPLPTPATITSGGKKPKGESGFGDFLSTVGILATALVVALLMITFIFRSYQVDGPSMESTLQNQDKLIIWKVPRTWARLTHHSYVPNRGDIIVFTESGLSQYGREDKKQLIKRVVGLPGDRVVVSGGTITIFNSANPTGFEPDKTVGYAYPNFPTTSGDIDVTLSKDQLFASGDNRPDSLDSRSFGPINADQIIGKLVVRVFPINQAKLF